MHGLHGTWKQGRASPAWKGAWRAPDLQEAARYTCAAAVLYGGEACDQAARDPFCLLQLTGREMLNTGQ